MALNSPLHLEDSQTEALGRGKVKLIKAGNIWHKQIWEVFEFHDFVCISKLDNHIVNKVVISVE